MTRDERTLPVGSFALSLSVSRPLPDFPLDSSLTPYLLGDSLRSLSLSSFHAYGWTVATMGHATADANGRTHVRAAMTPNITLRGKVHAVSTLNLRATSAHRGQVSQGGQVRVSFVQGSRRQPRYYIGCFAALLVYHV